MLRYIKYLFLFLLAVALLIVALANSHPVDLHLLPDGIAAFVPFPVSGSFPLYMVIFASLLAGLALGFVWEYLREAKHRAAVSRERREKSALLREVNTLREKTGEPKLRDDVLSIVDR
jgi:lipopolysaccharide assembly protein A